MDQTTLTEKARSHLVVLCSQIGERRVGSDGNREATTYAREVLEKTGWETEATKLSVFDWTTDGASLKCNDKSFEVFSSHYSLGCSVQGELVAVNTVAQLNQAGIKDKIVLLYGEIASQQIAPKNFPFWNPEEHRQLISLLGTLVPRRWFAQRNAIPRLPEVFIRFRYSRTEISISLLFT